MPAPKSRTSSMQALHSTQPQSLHSQCPSPATLHSHRPPSHNTTTSPSSHVALHLPLGIPHNLTRPESTTPSRTPPTAPRFNNALAADWLGMQFRQGSTSVFWFHGSQSQRITTCRWVGESEGRRSWMDGLESLGRAVGKKGGEKQWDQTR